MHEMARHLLQKIQSPEGIAPLDYDYFSNALEQMRIEIFTLKHELEHLLESRDPLTGATNRITMLPTLREQQELIKRQGEPCSIAMIDFDLFKGINDTYGHNAGDTVLVNITRYLIENIRPYDKIFRYGGEEFLLCFPFTELKSCKKMVERFRKGIEKMVIAVNNNQSIHVTVSIGVALLHPEYEAEKSVDHADQAMYDAKTAGRNCVKVWNADL
jgi:diguanylate cyclase (GGDEF)-like protein